MSELVGIQNGKYTAAFDGINGYEPQIDVPQYFLGSPERQVEFIAIADEVKKKWNRAVKKADSLTDPETVYDIFVKGNDNESTTLRGPVNHLMNGGFSNSLFSSLSGIETWTTDNEDFKKIVEKNFGKFVHRVYLCRELDNAIRNGKCVDVDPELLIPLIKDIGKRISDFSINGVQIYSNTETVEIPILEEMLIDEDERSDTEMLMQSEVLPNLNVRADEVIHWLEAINNAKKAKHKSVEIELLQDDEKTTFSITSSGGNAFTPEDIVKRFDPNFISDSSNFEAGGGHGTALLARDIRNWRGTLQIETTVVDHNLVRETIIKKEGDSRTMIYQPTRFNSDSGVVNSVRIITSIPRSKIIKQNSK